MANPNLVNVATVRGQTAYVLPSNTAAGIVNWTHDGTTALTGLTPAANSVNKINSILATNVTSNNASATVSISNNPTYASGTAYAIATAIVVPPNSSLIISDKSTSFYVTENQSVGVQTTVASALVFVASFEVLT